MLDLVVAAPFEDVREPLKIGIDICVRVLNRVAHPGLRREMDYPVGLFLSEQRRHRLAILDGHPVHGKIAMAGHAGQPSLFQRHFVIVIEIINTDDRVAAGKQTLGAMHANETGGPCQKNFHFIAFKPTCCFILPTGSTKPFFLSL